MPKHTQQERQKNRKRAKSPGAKARARNLRRTGAEIPSTTRGKPDKLTKAQQTRLDSVRTRERKEEKVVMGKIRKLRNDRFRREQEKKALNRRADSISGRKRKKP